MPIHLLIEGGRDEATSYSGDAEITPDPIPPGFRTSVGAFFPED